MRDDRGDREPDQQAVLEDGPAPLEPRRLLDPERGHHEHDQVEGRADQGHVVLVVGRGVAEEAQHVGTERDGQAGGADRVVHQHDPAGEETRMRVQRPAHPRVRRPGARLPRVQPLVADGDPEHRDEADQQGQEAGVADGGEQGGQRDRNALRRAGAGQREDHDVAGPQRVRPQPAVVGCSGLIKARLAARWRGHGRFLSHGPPGPNAYFVCLVCGSECRRTASICAMNSPPPPACVPAAGRAAPRRLAPLARRRA